MGRACEEHSRQKDPPTTAVQRGNEHVCRRKKQLALAGALETRGTARREAGEQQPGCWSIAGRAPAPKTEKDVLSTEQRFTCSKRVSTDPHFKSMTATFWEKTLKRLLYS